MRYKVVPPAGTMETLWCAHETLPLVPGTVEDCCTRIRDGTDVPSRDEARQLLTFLQALGLAAEAEEGFYRPRDPPAEAEIPAAFREHVYGAREVLDAVAEPATVEAAFADAIEPIVPRWERDREPDWRATWRERTERLLEWAHTFSLVERQADNRYRRTS